MFLMVSSSCKHVVNGYKIEVIEPTTESTTGCVAFFMKGGRGGGEWGIRNYRRNTPPCILYICMTEIEISES